MTLKRPNIVGSVGILIGATGITFLFLRYLLSWQIMPALILTPLVAAPLAGLTIYWLHSRTTTTPPATIHTGHIPDSNPQGTATKQP